MAPRGGSGDGGRSTYGFPIYCAAWLPLAHILKPDAPAAADDASSSAPPPPQPREQMAVLGGGGGEGRSGVPNKLVVAALEPDAAAPALSTEAALVVETKEEVPYRMAVHPRGDGVVCAFPNGCRLYKWESKEGKKSNELDLKCDEEALVELKDVGSQLAVSFSGEGSIFATGGEDGHLRAFNWPAMESILVEAETKASIKDLSFSSDEKFLAVNRSSGPCQVWDLNASEVIANLSREAGEIFSFCRFSNKTDGSHILFVAVQGDYGRIVSWNTTSWIRIRSKKITREAISAFAVSLNGDLLSIGTVEGSIIVLGSKNMQTLLTVKKAHLGIVTTLAFSEDSRTLLSTSFDSTARVTSVGSIESNVSDKLHHPILNSTKAMQHPHHTWGTFGCGRQSAHQKLTKFRRARGLTTDFAAVVRSHVEARWRHPNRPLMTDTDSRPASGPDNRCAQPPESDWAQPPASAHLPRTIRVCKRQHHPQCSVSGLIESWQANRDRAEEHNSLFSPAEKKKWSLDIVHEPR